eukprot:gb/GECG01001338.1/.p1 GENE.gb/GECG01001338.1/~~gb/GECG01001338.1/.p1  ORF type:complete len:100 (+),score=16.61 gb/GECG01001338.1/:1-300(+)
MKIDKWIERWGKGLRKTLKRISLKYQRKKVQTSENCLRVLVCPPPILIWQRSLFHLLYDDVLSTADSLPPLDTNKDDTNDDALALGGDDSSKGNQKKCC